MTKPFISIVIPMYNAEEFIFKAVQSVLATNYPNFEIVIVDDCSTDKSWEIVNKHFGNLKKIRLIKNKSNLLAAGSRNVGIKNAKGIYVALLDHDIEVDKNWLTEAIKVFDEHNNVGVVQGRVLDLTRRNIIQHAGIRINSYLGWVVALGFGKDSRSNGLDEIEVFANATGLIFKKKVWEEISGFDEDLAINTDDWDFNWRVWLYGYKEILAPKSITYHWSKKQKTRDKWIKRVPWEFHFAKVPWIFIKNYELKNLIRILPVYLAVNLFRGIVNLFFRFNPAPMIGYLQACWWLFANFSTLIKKRKIVQRNRKIGDSYLLNNIMDNSFLFGYFFKHWLPIFKLGKIMSTDKPY